MKLFPARCVPEMFTRMAKIRTDVALNRMVGKGSRVTDCGLTQEPLTQECQIAISVKPGSRPLDISELLLFRFSGAQEVKSLAQGHTALNAKAGLAI